MIQQSDTLIATVEHLATVVEEQAEIIKRLSLENAQLQEVEKATTLAEREQLKGLTRWQQCLVV